MKRIIYLVLLLSAFTFRGEAQYHITSVTRMDTIPHAYCDTVEFCIGTDYVCTVCSLAYVKTYFGDGTVDNIDYSYCSYASPPSMYKSHVYSFPGCYTMKNVLYIDSSMGFGSGLVADDSVITIVDIPVFCQTLPIRIFYDLAGSGVYNINDTFINFPVKIEVSRNGVVVDTSSCTSGIYYSVPDVIGDVYSFRIIASTPGTIITCPSTGIIYDTVSSYSSPVKYFGLVCSATASFDLAVNAVLPVTGVHDQYGNIYVSNSSCDPVNATVTMTFSPKYSYDGGAIPAPSSASGNSIIWNLSNVSHDPINLYYVLEDDAMDLVVGDSVQEHVYVTPTTGDINPANNTEMVIDTVKGGCDPNEMSVSPSGYISSGTQLQYTIGFENTGNDTAFNISVYDTLSDIVDIKSMNIVMASAVMNIAILNIGGHNIVKFDFPNINLLDSSHHGLCNGAVIFTVNAKDNLPQGATIFNHAGIFFDYNPVVMTDTVEDIIGFPACVTSQNKASKVSVYPNPSNNAVTIIADNTSYTIAIFTNVLGQQVLAQSLTASQTKVNISSLPTGMYYVTLRGAFGVKVVMFEKM